jgi:hypothetical protein
MKRDEKETKCYPKSEMTDIKCGMIRGACTQKANVATQNENDGGLLVIYSWKQLNPQEKKLVMWTRWIMNEIDAMKIHNQDKNQRINAADETSYRR